MHKALVIVVVSVLSMGVLSASCCEISVQPLEGECELTECIISLAEGPSRRSRQSRRSGEHPRSRVDCCVPAKHKLPMPIADFANSDGSAFSKHNGFGGNLVV